MPKAAKLDLANLDYRDEAHFEYRAIRYFAHRDFPNAKVLLAGPGLRHGGEERLASEIILQMNLRVGDDSAIGKLASRVSWQNVL